MKASNKPLTYPHKITTRYERLYVPDFLSRVSFPHRNPGDYYSAKDYKYFFEIESGRQYDFKKGESIKLGVPYGIYPRLILILIVSHAIHQNSREIILSENFTKLIKAVGYDPSGGQNGSITQIKRQILKLLNCRMSVTNIDPQKKHVNSVKNYLNHIDQIEIWENKNTNNENKEPIKAILSESFYNHIREHSIPVDTKTVEALRPSLMAIDFYFYLCGRTNRLNGEDAFIRWADLEKQIGSDYKSTKEFTRNAKISIRKIKPWYPQLNIKFKRGRLIIERTSKPHINPKLINKDL